MLMRLDCGVTLCFFLKCPSAFQVEKERPQRAPVLTSSTESFRSGLTGYAQLQAPKSSSPQKATRVCHPSAVYCPSTELHPDMPKA